MSAGKLTRRTFLTIAAMAASAAAVNACSSAATPTAAPAEATTAATQPPEAAATTAPAAATATTAPAAGAAKYAEAPALAELVQAGKLPPVEERLPKEPLIQPVVEEIGQYGGTWHRAAVSIGDTSLYYRLYPDGLVYFDVPGELTPAIAKKWEMSADGKEFTFYLREGMKWSDGEPYTADDIMFWYEDVVLNDDLSPSKPTWMMTNAELGKVTKVDDYTIKFTFSAPYGLFVEWLATLQFYGACKHYLSQFHPTYSDQATVDKAAADAEFESWYQYFGNRNSGYNNPDLPVVGAWKFVTTSDANPMVAERNPYYYRVDEQGQQLPYIDRISWEIVTSAEVLNFKAIAGEVDCQSRHINLVNYPLLDEGREKGDYRVITWPGDGGSDAGIIFNQDAGKQEGASDHEKAIGELLRSVEVRQALSSAIDREEIWDSAFLQFGEPRQMAPMQWSKYYEEGMEAVFTELDADTANATLDSLGLDKRDADGFRVAPDGQPFDFVIAAVELFGPWVDTAQLVNNYWNAVGVKSVVAVQARDLYDTQVGACAHQVDVWNSGGNGKALIYPYWVLPYSNGSHIAPLTGLWFDSSGKQGLEPTGDLKRVLELWQGAQTEPDEAKRTEAAKEIFRLNLDNLWTVGTVGGTPLEMGVVVVKNAFRNVPESPADKHVFNEDSVHTPANCIPAQYFIQQA